MDREIWCAAVHGVTKSQTWLKWLSMHIRKNLPVFWKELKETVLFADIQRLVLLSPVASTTGCCFCFGSIPSFFLELFLHWSPVVYWAPTDLGSSSFSILSFCLFILFIGFSRQEYWSGLPFSSPVDHIPSDLSTMTRPSWVAPRAWLSFIELDKAVVHVIRLTSFLWLWFQCVCLLMPLATPTILLEFLLPWT